MNRKTFAFPTTSCFVLATGFAFSSGPIIAQEDDTALEEITVVAPRQVTREVVGRSSSTGADIELVSLTRRVSYADLDLALHADVMKLEERINDTAREACDQLERLYPVASRDNRDCVGQAVGGAMQRVNEVIAGTEHN